MSLSGDYKNNPLYTDITNLDHLSPHPTFGYVWNIESGRWEPDTRNPASDTETHRLLSGISGVLEEVHIDVDIDHDTETHRLLSGISGALGNSDDTETHRLLSGISGVLEEVHIDVDIDHDTETHRLLSGISGKLENIGGSVQISGGSVGLSRTDTQPWKLRTKTVNQKIEEDFILMEDISEEDRYGALSGECFGEDKSVMDDIFGTYFNNGRMNKSFLETGHPNHFIHAEYTDPERCTDFKEVFHSDTTLSFRQENVGASLINSYELEDYNELYERGLSESITIHNNSTYPIQFHTADRRLNKSEPVSPQNKDILYLDSDMAVRIPNDEAGRVFVKRPHTISGFTVTYAITYKETGISDTIS